MSAGRGAHRTRRAPLTLWRMARCEVCGNDYGMSFEVHAQGAVHLIRGRFRTVIDAMMSNYLECWG